MSTNLPVVAPARSDLVFNRQPALWVAAVTIIVNGIVLFSDVLSQDTATYITATVSALLGFVVVWKVAEAALPAFTALVGAGIQLGIGLGWDLTTEQHTFLGTSVPALVGMFLWQNVTPYVQTGPKVLAPVDSNLPKTNGVNDDLGY